LPLSEHFPNLVFVSKADENLLRAIATARSNASRSITSIALRLQGDPLIGGNTSGSPDLDGSRDAGLSLNRLASVVHALSPAQPQIGNHGLAFSIDDGCGAQLAVCDPFADHGACMSGESRSVSTAKVVRRGAEDAIKQFIRHFQSGQRELPDDPNSAWSSTTCTSFFGVRGSASVSNLTFSV
jgi:hypothetical protein